MTAVERVKPLSFAMYVFLSALCIGFIGFVGGFFGPMILSTSNLGPLLGIFFTGPAGVLIGAAIGCAVGTRHADGDQLPRAISWFAGVCVVSLAYTSFLLRLGSWSSVAGIVVLLVVLSLLAGTLLTSRVRASSARVARKRGWLLAVAGVLVVIAAVFPPVDRPFWAKPGDPHQLPPGAPIPAVAYLFDARLDSSHHVPQLTVDVGTLRMEWLSVIVAAGLAWTTLRRLGGSDTKPAAVPTG